MTTEVFSRLDLLLNTDNLPMKLADLTCVGCNDLLVDQIACPLGHSLCKGCLKDNNKCPECSDKVTSLVPNSFATNFINSLDCKCPNNLKDKEINEANRKKNKNKSSINNTISEDDDNKKGCNWTGTIGELRQHIGNDNMIIVYFLFL